MRSFKISRLQRLPSSHHGCSRHNYGTVSMAEAQWSHSPLYPRGALRSIAADKMPGNADSFVVHSPNEVYEFLHA